MSGIRILIEDGDGKLVVFITSDGEGNYSVNAPGFRQAGENEYETTDGLHVAGLIDRVFGAYDSTEYLRRRLVEHERVA